MRMQLCSCVGAADRLVPWNPDQGFKWFHRLSFRITRRRGNQSANNFLRRHLPVRNYFLLLSFHKIQEQNMAFCRVNNMGCFSFYPAD